MVRRFYFILMLCVMLGGLAGCSSREEGPKKMTTPRPSERMPVTAG